MFEYVVKKYHKVKKLHWWICVGAPGASKKEKRIRKSFRHALIFVKLINLKFRIRTTNSRYRHAATCSYKTISKLLQAFIWGVLEKSNS